VLILIILYSNITTLFIVSFLTEADFVDPKIEIINSFVEICFGVDILLNFITAYEDPNTGELEMDFRKISC
jgi:hypothetical protein